VQQNKSIDYREGLEDDESLKCFLGNVREFDRLFCEMVGSGKEFSLKFEVHGNRGMMIHCKVSYTSCDRPAGTQRKLQEVNQKNALE